MNPGSKIYPKKINFKQLCLPLVSFSICFSLALFLDNIIPVIPVEVKATSVLLFYYYYFRNRVKFENRGFQERDMLEQKETHF